MILPLIGDFDTARIEQLQQTLLNGVAAQRSAVVVIDLTGVSTMDKTIAAGFVDTARMVRLLGAQVVITGLRPTVAAMLADLNVDFGGVTICATLQEGVNRALGGASGEHIRV